MLLARAWALPSTFLIALALALLCWNNELGTTQMPSFEFPVRIVRICVVAAGLLLLRPTIDRFQEISLVSPRPVWLLDLGRYAVTGVAFAMVGLVELSDGRVDGTTPFTALGWMLALGSVAAALQPQYYWVVTLLAGFLWLQVSLHDVSRADISPALSVLIVTSGAVLYVAACAGMRRRALSGAKARGGI